MAAELCLRDDCVSVLHVVPVSPRGSTLEGNGLKSLKTVTYARVAEVLLEKGREMHESR